MTTHQEVRLARIAEYTSYDGGYDVCITDGMVRYKRRPTLEGFVQALAAEPVRLGNGVEWYDLDDGLDPDARLAKGLLTRKDSRGLINAVIRNANKHVEKSLPTMSFIIGSPGIGKTRTLAFALRQMLQNAYVNVQYFSQKDTTAILFLRRNGTTYAYESDNLVPEIASGDLFSRDFPNRLRTYILLDPSERGARFARPRRAQLIVACSANSKHYHNIEKEANAFKFFLGLPSTKEIETMASKLKPELDHKLLLKRISDVGPVPRYLFRDDAAFDDRKEDIYRKGATSVIDEAVVLTALTDGHAISNDPSLCGALFAHVNVETTDAQGVKSTNYQQQRVSVLSQYAAWLLYKKFRGAFVQATINGRHCDTTAVFEILCAFDLIIGGNFKVADMKLATRSAKVKHIAPAASVIRVMPSRNETETRELFVKPALSGLSSISTDYEVSESYEPPEKKRRIGPPFIVLSDGFSAIDFLNTNRQVFQATMGADHDMKGWVDLLLDATILTLDKSEKLTINAKAQPLEFYWVVPNDKAGWATRRPKVPTKTDIPTKYLTQKDVIDQAIAKHVCQFVLFIEKEQPRRSEFWSNLVPLHGGGDKCILM